MGREERDEFLLRPPGESQGSSEPEGDLLRGPRPEPEAPPRAEPLGQGVEPEQLHPPPGGALGSEDATGSHGSEFTAGIEREAWERPEPELIGDQRRGLAHLIYWTIFRDRDNEVSSAAFLRAGVPESFDPHAPITARVYLDSFCRVYRTDPERLKRWCEAASREAAGVFLGNMAQIKAEYAKTRGRLGPIGGWDSFTESVNEVAIMGLDALFSHHQELVIIGSAAGGAALLGYPRFHRD